MLMTLGTTPDAAPLPHRELAAAPAHEERRHHERHTVRRDTIGRLLTEQSPVHLWARVLDCSCEGLALLLPQRLPEGSSFVLEVRDPNAKVCRRLEARVVHVAELESGSYRTGGRLERNLREEELDDLFA